MLGFIGCGTMGTAIVEGLINKKLFTAEQVLIFDKEKSKVEELSQRIGAVPSASLEKLCENARIIFIAVKPQDVGGLLEDLKPCLSPTHVLVSVAAGIRISFFLEQLGRPLKIARVMPNTPCLVGEGMSVISSGEDVSDEEEQEIKRLMEAVGRSITLDEKHMDAVTGLSGSGPAYVLLMIEALADGGVEAGLSRQESMLLAAQTVLGAARMYLEGEEHPAELKNRVTSPGGTTSAGLLAMEEGGIRAALIKAVKNAAQRGRELGG